jgi:hypothetical protein
VCFCFKCTECAEIGGGGGGAPSIIPVASPKTDGPVSPRDPSLPNSGNKGMPVMSYALHPPFSGGDSLALSLSLSLFPPELVLIR